MQDHVRVVGISLRMRVGRVQLGVCFVSPPDTAPYFGLMHFHKEDNQPPVCQGRQLQFNQLPKIGEWTRIVISHEEEGGKYYLSLGVGGTQMARKRVTDPELRNMTDVEICIGNGDRPHLGFIKGLVVLQK